MSISDARDLDSRVHEGRLSTGIEVLDEDLIRGIPSGSTIGIIGDPRGMGRLIPYYLPLTGRETQYVSTLQPAEAVEDSLYSLDDYPDLDEGGERLENLSVEDTISGTESNQEAIQKYVNRIGENHNLVIDTISTLGDSDEFQKVVRNIQTKTRRENGLSYLYFANTSIDEFSRQEREALHSLDGVFDVELGKTGDTIETRLHVYRLTGSDIPDEVVKLNVGTALTVDTTRDIA